MQQHRGPCDQRSALATPAPPENRSEMTKNQPRPRPFLVTTLRFANGTETPRTYLEQCLAALDEWEPKVGAFVFLNVDAARASADQSAGRWRAGKPLSAIDGMPIGIKDIMETIDMPTGQGSPLFEGWQTHRDAAAVAALRDAGAIVVGKTVTTEFAAAEPRGTRNPWDPSRTPGGSSSGSAAAVACGMLPAALGTQVIGSIVRPASYCGCIGFKPSVGAINRGGSFDCLSQSSSGVLAATLEDAWQVAYEVVSRAGGDPGFPGMIGPAQLPLAVRPQRLTLLQTAGWAFAAPQARDQLASATDKLANAGVEIVTRADDPRVAAVEANIADAFSLSKRINAWEGRWPLNTYSARDASKLSIAMQSRLSQAESMTVDDYRAAIAERARIRSLYQALASDIDGCITLSATSAAPVGLSSTGNPVFNVPFSLLGVPALSLPLLQEEGLPLGLQVTGFEGRDAATFALAAWLMQELGGVPSRR